MNTAESAHIIQPEEVMAYLEGELQPDRASAVRAHLTTCVSCQSVAADVRRVSQVLAEWHVPSAPSRLAAPSGSVTTTSVSVGKKMLRAVFGHTPLAAVAALVLVIGTLFMMKTNKFRVAQSEASIASAEPRAIPFGGGSANRSASATGLPQQGMPIRLGGAPDGPKIARTVRLSIVTTEFEAVRPAIDRIVRDVSGFVGNIQASDPKVAPRSVHATLRIPAARLDDALAGLRRLGHVVDETQAGEDIGDQITDVAARLANARNTENRLNDILANRTGNVQSVLDVEREIARVRTEIEQLDAQRVRLDDRVAFATVTVSVAEERRATVDPGPFPLRGRLRNAFVDGLRQAADSIVEATLLTLRAGPVLLVWLPVAWFVSRPLIRRLKAPPSL